MCGAYKIKSNNKTPLSVSSCCTVSGKHPSQRNKRTWGNMYQNAPPCFSLSKKKIFQVQPPQNWAQLRCHLQQMSPAKSVRDRPKSSTWQKRKRSRGDPVACRNGLVHPKQTYTAEAGMDSHSYLCKEPDPDRWAILLLSTCQDAAAAACWGRTQQFPSSSSCCCCACHNCSVRILRGLTASLWGQAISTGGRVAVL